jgi:hypothetical protein
VSQLRARGTLFFQYFVAAGNSNLCPSEQSGDRGLFVTQHTTSRLCVLEWRETSTTIQVHDLDVATIPTEDWSSTCRTGRRGSSRARRSIPRWWGRRGELWAAWSGARRVAGQRQPSFPHPHIGLAIIRVPGFTLAGQRYLWNDEHAFVYPSLTTNPAGYPNHPRYVAFGR